MLHYTSHPTHTHFVCGTPTPTTDLFQELDPEKTTCEACLGTLAWRLDREAQIVLTVINAGADDAKAIAESARIMLAAALNIIERLQRCHQIIQDNRGHITRTKAGL